MKSGRENEKVREGEGERRWDGSAGNLKKDQSDKNQYSPSY
jgi:hypothetical protein